MEMGLHSYFEKMSVLWVSWQRRLWHWAKGRSATWGTGGLFKPFGYRNIFWYKKTIVLLILVPHVPVPRDSSLWKTAQADHDQGREKCCFHTLAEGEIDLDKDCLSKTGSMSFWLYQYPPKRYNLDSTGQNTWNPSVISGVLIGF